jgi:hypothetical protein
MTIVIDARLNAYRNGGIPQYTRQLIYAMAEVAPTTAMTILQHRRQPERMQPRPNSEGSSLPTGKRTATKQAELLSLTRQIILSNRSSCW